MLCYNKTYLCTDDDEHYHRTSSHTNPYVPKNEVELDTEFWVNEAQQALRTRLADHMNNGIAKNVIMFLGDGLSVSTLAAARTLLGQREGRTGEETRLSFEEFPIVGLAKVGGRLYICRSSLK